jgi:hypothetical protein
MTWGQSLFAGICAGAAFWLGTWFERWLNRKPSPSPFDRPTKEETERWMQASREGQFPRYQVFITSSGERYRVPIEPLKWID